jgi:hypothetical protein
VLSSTFTTAMSELWPIDVMRPGVLNVTAAGTPAAAAAEHAATSAATNRNRLDRVM